MRKSEYSAIREKATIRRSQILVSVIHFRKIFFIFFLYNFFLCIHVHFETSAGEFLVKKKKIRLFLISRARDVYIARLKNYRGGGEGEKNFYQVNNVSTNKNIII